MNLFRSLVVGALCCVALPDAVASAQGLSSPTLDLAFQGWDGQAKDRLFSNHGGVALDAVATSRVRKFSRVALVVGAGVAAETIFAANDCMVPAPPAVFTGCAPNFPEFSSLTALAGVEGRYGFIARVLAGPSVLRAGERGTAVGLQGRVDLSTPALIHVSLVASARGAWIPNFEGESHRIRAVGVGVRFQ